MQENCIAPPALALCAHVRDDARVATQRVRTATYNQAARDRLADAATKAREAAGFRYRTEFIAAYPNLNLRSLTLLESGESGVGHRFLQALAEALPNWTEDTPRLILEGEDPPSVVARSSTPQAHSTGHGQRVKDLSHLPPATRREVVREVLDMLPLLRNLGDDVYADLRDRAMELAHLYGAPDDSEQSGRHTG